MKSHAPTIQQRQTPSGAIQLFMMLMGLTVSTVHAQRPSSNWPSFRGAHAQGIAEGQHLPFQWNVDTSQNIKWKTPIPGLGHSSPIVWGDRIFVTTAVSTGGDPYLKVGLYGSSPDHPEDYDHEYRVLCVDTKTGDVLWQRTAAKEHPKVKRHIKASHANCTPATDGKHVVAFFGSMGLYCYSVTGDLIWREDFGVLDAGPINAPDLQWGFASSPIIHKGRVYVQCDTRSLKFIVALNITDGSEAWRIGRDDVPTWSTPTIDERDGQDLLFVNGYKHIGGYDAATGREVFRLRGGGDIPVPTPVVWDDLIYITNAHGGQSPIYAIRTNAEGDVSLADGATSNESVVWSKRAGSYMQTPLVYGGVFYSCRDNGILSCLDPKTGDKYYRKRLSRSGEGFTASPVAADGKVYFSSENGNIHVVKAGPDYDLLAVNAMGEITMATPAISANTLFIRTQNHLVAVSESSGG